MTHPAVRAARPSEVDTVTDLLTAAFQDDPINTWLFPDAERRRTDANPAFYRILTEATLAAGRIDLTEDASAVALWTPGGPDDGEFDLPGLTQDEIDRMDVVFRLLGKRIPDEPHWHVQFVGVRPDRQGRGLGSHLMRHGLARADAEGTATYLEASAPRNVHLYHRLGYRDHGGEPITLPGGGPAFRPMWRAVP
ncbi:GNAT family N-acetyltransferase [Amycolatopsis jejuensis]|uniref:GNAT family N-acetyltransferase n=1 Tax=Amycolatopsis jejuensis TaxID=330084 RepID=UPI0005254F3C|nr:GNAT family N-acetyltransferase [Amycolatopsis jejuensis]